MEIFTSKLQIHRAIIKVRRKIELIEDVCSGKRYIFHGTPAIDLVWTG